MKGVFLWSIYEYLLSLIEVLLFYDFLHYTIKRNIKIKNAYHILSMILLSILIFVLTQINIYSMLRTIIMYVIFLLIAYKMFMGNLKEKFLFVTVFYFFLIFTDILSVNIISYFVGRDIKDIIINQTWARMIFSQISKLLLFIILKIIKDDYKGRKTEIPVHYWYWILFVYLISVINLLVIFPLEKYSEVTKVPVDKTDIEKSIELIKQSTVDHEFRTTIARNILSREDIVNIARMLQGEKLYILQSCVPTKILDPLFLAQFEPYTHEELEQIANLTENYVLQCLVR